MLVVHAFRAPQRPYSQNACVGFRYIVHLSPLEIPLGSGGTSWNFTVCLMHLLGFHLSEPFSVSVYSKTHVYIYIYIHAYIHTTYIHLTWAQASRSRPGLRAAGPGLGPGPDRAWDRAQGSLGPLRDAWAHVRCMSVVCVYAWMYMYACVCCYLLWSCNICNMCCCLLLFCATCCYLQFVFVAILYDVLLLSNACSACC
jgi:hypothetical protein